MNIYHFAVCDDRPEDARLVASLAAQWARRTGAEVELEVFPSAEAFLFRYQEKKDFDILLLDIEMTGMDGVAAITIIMYVLMFVSALFIGYSYGVAPMISYFHGEGNHEKLKKLIRFSARFIAGASALCVAASIAASGPLVGIFTRPGTSVYDLAVTGNRLCSLALLFVGLNVFASGMFTALSNGVVSAVLAFSRSFVFTVASIQILPVLLGGVTGVWLATPAAELLAVVMAAGMVVRYRKRYGY